MILALVRFTNIMLAALLAGTSFGIWIGFNPVNYSPSTYLAQQENLVLSLNTLMVSLVIAATLVTLLSAWLHRQNRVQLIILIVAAISFASCLLISRFGNLPIQNEMLTWTLDSLPENWTSMRNDWWYYHIMRTIAELIALVLVTWASTQAKPSDT